jgi:hypothetical protein
MQPNKETYRTIKPGKRELIDTGTDKRYVKQGWTVNESVGASRSIGSHQSRSYLARIGAM